MSVLSNIFSKGAKEIVDSAGNLIDNISTSDAEKLSAKNELSNIVFTSLGKLQDIQREIIVTEASGNWLQRSWRPIVMLAFAGIVILGAFIEIPYLSDNSKFWSLLEIGMGGYVIGRSAEKVTESVTNNIDLSSLKKKYRKDNYK